MSLYHVHTATSILTWHAGSIGQARREAEAEGHRVLFVRFVRAIRAKVVV